MSATPSIERRRRPPSDATSAAPANLAGELHATGRARFICDEPAPAGMCFAKVVASPFAHARIGSLSIDAAVSAPGVVAVLVARDIPGQNQIGSKIKDEPLLPEREVCYRGQPVCVVVAESEDAATAARALVQVDYEELDPILTIEQGLAAKSFLAPELRMSRGNVERALQKAEHVLEGVISSGSQEHVYMETQCARAVPGEDEEIILYSATQAPSEVQEIAARILGLARKDVTVDVKRLGGAFGGKESAATLWACLAALASFKTRRPVELRLARSEDMAWTGKRHPFESRYRVGFDRRGRLLAYDVEFNADGGAFTDLTMAILQRAVLHAENAYFIRHVRVVARPCRTNLPPNTAFRGFGAPQGVFAIESVITRVAHFLKSDPIQIRKLNAYREGQTAPYGQIVHEAVTPALLDELRKSADYDDLKRRVAAFNRANRFRKRGIGVVPIKFGISFTAPFLNQGSALIQVYADGSVSVSHGGVEMGQEINTKVAQIAADELGVTLDRVRIESHSTKRTANTPPTAASTGADLNGNAARIAARRIIARLRPVARDLLKAKFGRAGDARQLVFGDNHVYDRRAPQNRIAFRELVSAAWLRRVDLGARGFYKTPGLRFDWKRGRGTPFAYYVFGCALVVVEVDVLTGYFTLKHVHIIHEVAQSVNPAVDLGQIEGAFMQGFGWCTMEEVVRDARGRNLTESLTTYKIPTIKELPENWNIEMRRTLREYAGVKGSKAVGEPPFLYGEAVFFAIKDAIESLADHKREANLHFPATPEAIAMAAEEITGEVATP